MATRPLAGDELLAAGNSEALSEPAHLFLKNQLLAEAARAGTGSGEPPQGRFYGVFSPHGLELVAFFGASRLLCHGPGPLSVVDELADLALAGERGARIVIGPRQLGLALLARLRPFVDIDVDRSQPFMCVSDERRLGPSLAVRLANRKDAGWLLQASLQLNEEDLGIRAATVDRRVLRQRVLERIQDGLTWLTEATPGHPASKLEVGIEGPAGALIEGVFTDPQYRGQGFARGLVAAVSRDLLQRCPHVGLHVGRSNEAAIAAYDAAGFEEVEDLELALLTWR